MMRWTIAALSALAVAAIAVGAWRWQRAVSCRVPVSQLGAYCGYGEARFDGYQRQSSYVVLADGRRLAIDVLRPTRGGLVADEPLPVLYQHTIYNRAMTIVREGEVSNAALLKLGPWRRILLKAAAVMSGGDIVIDQAGARPWIRRMLRQGYVVVAADASGTGASGGLPLRSFEEYGREAAMVIDWIVAQPWSDGRVGMYGQSFTAMIALAATAQDHPALRAVYGASVAIDAYRAAGWRGGMRDIGFGDSYVRLTAELDALATPVDGDRDRLLLEAAQHERVGATFSARARQLWTTQPYVDSVPASASDLSWADASLYPIMHRIRASRIPIYLEAGWLDIFTRDTALVFANLEGPRRLLVRPWRHRVLTAEGPDLDPGYEAARWFDHWLRDFDNGVEREAQVHAAILTASGQCGWASVSAWPPSAPGRTLFIDGDRLAFSTPNAPGAIGRETDLSATTGVDSRWNGVLGEGRYRALAQTSSRGLSFTSEVLAAPLFVFGHPVLSILVSVEGASDAAVIALLEDVAPDGRVTYVTEGALRASHRARGAVGYETLGLPIMAHSASAVAPLAPHETAQLAFDLQPVGFVFQPGHRVRLTILNSDADNLVAVGGPYRFTVHWTAASNGDAQARGSWLALPVATTSPESCVAAAPRGGQ